jgi:hypothetical protein
LVNLSASDIETCKGGHQKHNIFAVLLIDLIYALCAHHRRAVRKYSRFHKSQIHKFADCIFLDLRTFRTCGNLQICDLWNQFFGGLKTSANPQKHNFFPEKYKLKMLSFKFKDEFWLLGQF